jgi:cobalt-zinc-cadmium efflux system outer membrane protein
MENQIVLGQKFPLWGKLSRQRKVATLMAEKATFNLETLQVMVVFQMNKNYANYLKLKHSLDILEQYQEELNSFRKVALTQYSTGTGMTQHPILKLQIETALVKSKINTLQTKLDAVENTLQALFDGAFSPDLFPPDWDIVVPIDSAGAWLKRAEVTHPGYLQARTNLLLAQVQQELATRKNYPDLVTGLTYTSIGPTSSEMPGVDSGADALGVKLGLNLPLWFRRNKARVESATLNVKAQEELVADVWNEIEQEVHSVVLQRDEIEETYQLYYGGLLQEADQMVSSAFSAYETGKISFLDLLDSERMAVRIRLEFEAVIAERRIAAAQLLKAVGLIDLNEE